MAIKKNRIRTLCMDRRLKHPLSAIAAHLNKRAKETGNEKLKTSRNNVYYWYYNKWQPRGDRMVEIAAFFNKDVNDVFYFSS